MAAVPIVITDLRMCRPTVRLNTAHSVHCRSDTASEGIFTGLGHSGPVNGHQRLRETYACIFGSALKVSL
jgi:hypothetical protein